MVSTDLGQLVWVHRCRLAHHQGALRHNTSAQGAATDLGESILIDPYLAPGRRTRASVLIDTNNWQAKKLDSSNVFEIKAFFIGDNKTAIQLVVIFDRWTFERGAQIRTDNRLETYGTREDVMTERYAIYSVFGIRPPCIIDIEFQSTPIQPHEPSEPLSLVSEPKPQLAPPASRQPSAYEIEKKLRTLDQFLDFLNTEMRPTVEQGNRVRDLAWEVFRDRERNAAYQEDMEAHIRMVRMNYEAFERLRASSQQYPDIVQTTQQGYGTALEVTASDYMRAFARLLAYLKDDTPHQHFSEIMSERRAALDAALNAFRAWRQRTINTLAEMRRTLAP